MNEMKSSNGGNGVKGCLPEIREGLDKKSPEELQELAKLHSDVDGRYRIQSWIDGKMELDDEKVEKLLPGLPMLFYERKRKDISKKLGIRTSVLDQIRDPRGERAEDIGQGTKIIFEDPEPWPESVDGAVLLDDLKAIFEKYIVLPNGAVDTLALWTAFTYLHDNFWISPILCITSPQKRCGKTQTLTILQHLVAKPLPATNLTPATVFRTIEKFSPTMLIDEADTFLRNSGSRNGISEDLRGIINSGHARGQAWVPRCVDPDNEVKLFSTWTPKAIALIGNLPSTIADRSILLKLQRKSAKEEVERLRLDRLYGETKELQRKLFRWAKDVSRFIKDIDPPELTFLNDRAADNWRPLIQIAMSTSSTLKGNTWVDRAIEASRVLSIRGEEEELGSLLLEDLKKLFEEIDTDRISSEDIVNHLSKLEDSPWPEYKKGNPITKRQLAIILKRYDVTPDQIKINGVKHRGYKLSDIDPLFMRYCGTFLDNSIQQEELQGTGSVPDDEKVPDRYGTRDPNGTLNIEFNSFNNKEISKDGTVVPDKTEGMEDIKEILKNQGYVPWRADVLDGETIVIIQDPSVIPDQLKSHVLYTLEEIEKLQGMSPEKVKAAHLVKKSFMGEIVGTTRMGAGG